MAATIATVHDAVTEWRKTHMAEPTALRMRKKTIKQIAASAKIDIRGIKWEAKPNSTILGLPVTLDRTLRAGVVVVEGWEETYLRPFSVKISDKQSDGENRP